MSKSHSPKIDRNGDSERKVALMGLLFAVAIALNFVESQIPSLVFLPQGVKLGLSNIVTMYSLFVLGPVEGLSITLIKSLFVFLTRGVVAAAMSLSGGLCSIAVMLLLSKIRGIGKEYLLLSVFGSVFHNMGQLAVSILIVDNIKILYYCPILILSGILMGILTGLILRVIMPYISKFR